MSCPTSQQRALDLGCGPNKRENTWGVDRHPYAGVDQVLDLDANRWDLPDSHFDMVHVRHVIEHVADITAFLGEVHRVARDGAVVEVTTPHFSSLDSWKDPTHRWHLASSWHESITSDYLSAQLHPFKHEGTTVSFGSSLRSLPGRLILHLFGLAVWEKHYAFRYPARNIVTRLRVRK